MANNIIKRVWNQNKMVAIEDLKGMTFQNESEGHTFQISGIDDDGNTVALTGTPSGVLLRPDNTDVALTCSVSGGVVSATLPANCYDVPGRFGLTIFITSGSSKTAIYAAVGTVTRTSSGTVAPGTSQSVVDLINAINAAVNSIPASYSALLADIAPTYSNSALYSVGQYAWYDGDLKRCIVPITTAESYTAAHWTSAVLGQDVSDLKSALFTSTGNEHLETTPTKYTDLSGEYAVLDQTNASMRGLVVSCSEGDAFTITTHGGGAGRAYGWLKSDNEIIDTTGTYANFENEVIVAPENAAYLAVNSYNFVPTIYRGQLAVKKLDEVITALDIFNREEPLTLPESYYTFSGKILNPDGVAVNNASYATTDYIYLPNGDNRFSGKAFPNNTYNTLVFYDDKREKVGAVKGNYDFIVSKRFPTAKYFRASTDTGIGIYYVTIRDAFGINSNIVDNFGNIYSHLHFTGKILKSSNGFIRADTTDTNIINSDFIPIEEFISAEMIGSPTNDCITAAFFSDANDASFLQAYNGDTARPLVSGWYQQTITPDMVDNAKYVVLQANSDATLLDKATPLYVSTKKQLINFGSNSVKKIYNVKDYGAIGDGITDDTAAIQSAINDCYNHGGGEVYFPAATYALNTVSTRSGVTAHLFIPMENVLEKRRTIRLTGETSVMYPSFYIQFGGYAAHKPWFIGSTLKSNYIPSDAVISNPIAVIASAPATNFTGCNFTRLQIEHLNIATSIDSTENYPKVSGINASNIASVSIKDVTVGTDSKCTTLVAPPDGHVSYGIGMPKRLCDPNQLVEEVCIAGGYKYGLISTEHVNGSNVQIQNTIYAFAFAQTDHPNYFSLCSAHGCKYQVAALGEGFGSYWYGNSGIRFALLDFEENVNQNPTAFNYTAGVYDPHNRLHGSLNYFMVKSGVGATNADWAVVGAESLNITSENT